MPLIYGLSHVFGETLHFSETTEKWKKRGFEEHLHLTTSVLEEKRRFLDSHSSATHCDLILLRHKLIPFGIERLRHRPHTEAAHRTNSAAVEMIFENPDLEVDFSDSEISFLCQRAEERRIRIRLKTQDVFIAKTFLERLGFKESEDRLILGSNLLNQCPIEIRLVSDKSFVPRIDAWGFSGLSFWVPRLEALNSLWPLAAVQVFQGIEGRSTRLGFSIAGGFMVEFFELEKGPS